MFNKNKKKNNLILLLAGVGLVSGTTIGAGTLALPTSTAIPGFLPTLGIFIVTWIFMTMTALLLLEVNQWFPGEKNLISLSESTLGQGAKIFAWISYLLLLYGLISAYLMALSTWAVTAPIELFGKTSPLSLNQIMIIMTILSSIMLYFGMWTIDRINRVLMVGLVVSFLLLIALVAPHASPQLLLSHADPIAAWSIFPLVLTTFGFAIIVPSLNGYFKRDTKILKKIIWIGSIIPLVVYIIWEYCILGNIPLEGSFGLMELLANNQHLSVTRSLAYFVTQSSWLKISVHVFYVCIVLTSFLGVSVSLLHFLEDGLKVHAENRQQRFWLVGLTYLPPLVIMLYNPHTFDRVLSFAGIFVALILGILPALMVWRGRYHHRFKGSFQVLGGKTLLIGCFVFFSYVIVQEIVNCFSSLPQ